MDARCFLYEEVREGESDSDSDSDTQGATSDSDRTVKESKGQSNISKAVADLLYREAGTPFTSQTNEEMTVLPKPMVMYSEAEQLIIEAKDLLNIEYALDPFQIQALLGIEKSYTLKTDTLKN